MKYLLIIVCVILATLTVDVPVNPTFPISMIEECQAETYTHQRIGNFDYVTGSDGYSGTGQQVGNFYYYNDNS